MAELVKEGWYEDPASRHEYRWFSEGVPTDLVKDAGKTSRDAISMADPRLYRPMSLEHEPDDGPLLHKDDAPPPKLELVNIGGGPGMGYAGVINTAASSPDPAVVWAQRAGTVETTLVVLPVVLGGLVILPFVAAGELPIVAVLAPAPLSLLIAVLGGRRRRRRARRRQRSAASRRDPQRA